MLSKIIFSFAFIVIIAMADECGIGYTSNWWSGCADIDECTNSTICATGECVNTVGSYKCVGDTGDNSTTEDDSSVESTTFGDEIETKEDMTERVIKEEIMNVTETEVDIEESTTVSTEDNGSCKPGYARNWWGNCNDIDECYESTHNCSDLQTCINNEGGFECKCPDDQETCVSIPVDPCASNPCNLQTSVCRSTNNSYECECKNGYIKGGDEECKDLDECSLGNCSHKCQNTEGSFKCSCPPGYELEANLFNCTDINECEQLSPCEQGCRNNLGSFTCYCENGYTLVDGNRCLPEVTTETETKVPEIRTKELSTGIERETEEESHVLIKPYRNQMNGKCEFGYYYNKRTHICEDIDECKLNLHNCERNEDCRNNIGSFMCFECETGSVRNSDGSCEQPLCYPGYVYDDEKDKCVDFDECTHIAPCGHKPCYNVEGAYFCGCYGEPCPVDEYRKGCIPGFEPSRFSIKHCKDINECSNRSLNNCGKNEVCVNTFGGFICQCKVGFKRDRFGRCADINECNLVPGICFGTCLNSEGSYKCVESTADRQRQGGECNGYIDAKGQCIGECEDTEVCKADGCVKGYKLDSQGICVDINECEEDICDDEERCENTDGGYICVDESKCEGTNCKMEDKCKDGYEKDRSGNCVDIDECENKRICGAKRCQNNEGSYSCVDNSEDSNEQLECRRGFEMDSSGVCVDINECENRRICGDKHCENTEGSYRCIGEEKRPNTESCSPGFFYDKILKTCVDIDECQIEMDNCMEFMCENTIGSFRCLEQTCYPGYESVRNICLDINECDRLGENACEANETCHNSKGAYFCQKCFNEDENRRCYARKQCMPGFEPKKLPYFACADVDECEAGYHDCSAEEQCVNTIPGYRCDCKPGYTRNRKNECVTEHNSCGIDNICPDLTQPNPCLRGYQLSRDKLKCEDIDECLRNPCGPDEECRNYRGSYRCYVVKV